MINRAGTKIVIVGGGGTFGSSTALHLVRSGYTPSNITILDVYPVPSPQSAGNDLNKIMGIEYEDEVDLKLSLECREMWNEDELFKPFFHGTGKVNLSSCPSQWRSRRCDGRMVLLLNSVANRRSIVQEAKQALRSCERRIRSSKKRGRAWNI